MDFKKTQKHQIIDLLWDGEFHITGDFIKKLFIYQYNARIKELRTAGFDIISTHNDIGYVGFKMLTPTNLINYKQLKVELDSQVGLEI